MRIGITLLALACTLPLVAQQQFPVRHQRSLWWDKPGELHVTDAGIRFVGSGTKGDSAPLELGWDDIQQLTLSEAQLEIVTYRDQRWQFGRDRHFRFVLATDADAGSRFADLESRLDMSLGQRLVRAHKGEPAAPLWSIPAKRTGLPRGVEGTLYFDGKQLRFVSERPGQSRNWPLSQVASIASTGPLSFTVVAPERALADQGGHRSFEFQLKQPLTPERYRQLWLSIEAAHGTRLRFQNSQ
ncbi:MAG: hypothetical protein KIT83_14235 [Bryobacterales bacterium]|nr:hypothetical protein [Bryobacterales bacterium]